MGNVGIRASSNTWNILSLGVSELHEWLVSWSRLFQSNKIILLTIIAIDELFFIEREKLPSTSIKYSCGKLFPIIVVNPLFRYRTGPFGMVIVIN